MTQLQRILIYLSYKGIEVQTLDNRDLRFPNHLLPRNKDGNGKAGPLRWSQRQKSLKGVPFRNFGNS